jgi:NADH-quinone oxidoreductase subunit C
MEQKYSAIIDSIKVKHPEAIISAEQLYDIPCIHVNKEYMKALVMDLKDNFRFNFLTDLTVVHYPDNKGNELCGSYLFHNWVDNIRLRMKVFTSTEDNHLPSLVGVYKAANWLEREAFDNFGVKYDEHPDLRRILNMDEMDYHPLLKQYALEDESRRDKDDTFFER